MTIGDNLNKILKEKNIKAYKLAKEIELDPGYLYSILRNENINPSIKVLVKISKKLNLNINELLNEVDF